MELDVRTIKLVSTRLSKKNLQHTTSLNQRENRHHLLLLKNQKEVFAIKTHSRDSPHDPSVTYHSVDTTLHQQSGFYKSPKDC